MAGGDFDAFNGVEIRRRVLETAWETLMRGVGKWRSRIGLGCFIGAVLPLAGRATAADLADQIPSSALLTIEWSKISDNCPLLDVAQAILDSPLLTKVDRDFAQARQALEFAKLAGRHSGII